VAVHQGKAKRKLGGSWSIRGGVSLESGRGIVFSCGLKKGGGGGKRQIK